MRTIIDVRSEFYARARWGLAAVALSAVLSATPAQAIVYQDTDAQSAGLGAGHAFLDGEATVRVPSPGKAITWTADDPIRHES